MGSIGNIWGENSKTLHTINIYVYPVRYTSEFLKDNDTFTVSFFDEQYKKDLVYLGCHSERNEYKIKNTNLNPVELNNSVTYKEAKISFLCKKLYQHRFAKDGLDKSIKDYYAASPNIYPDFKGSWQPHIVFIGEVIKSFPSTTQL